MQIKDTQIHIIKNHPGYPRIKELILAKNRLASIPDFTCLEKLEYLCLKENKILSIPFFVGEYAKTSLQHLNLDDNQISYIPEYVNHFPFVITLFGNYYIQMDDKQPKIINCENRPRKARNISNAV
jgi:Leucine-rich repeat (LRR) protein